MKRFKFLPLTMGSGWISGHVAIDEYVQWHDGRPGGKNIILNHDTDSFKEFSAEIDALIAELEEVREVARRKFAKVTPPLPS